LRLYEVGGDKQISPSGIVAVDVIDRPWEAGIWVICRLGWVVIPCRSNQSRRIAGDGGVSDAKGPCEGESIARSCPR
jgi:hypothetical protein